MKYVCMDCRLAFKITAGIKNKRRQNWFCPSCGESARVEPSSIRNTTTRGQVYPARNWKTAELLEMFKLLEEDGLTYSQAGERLGKTKAAIYQVYKRHRGMGIETYRMSKEKKFSTPIVE